MKGFEGIFWVVAIAVEKVLGVVDHLALIAV